MKRSIMLAAALLGLAAGPARAHCPIPYTITGPAGMTYYVFLKGYEYTPSDGTGIIPDSGTLSGGNNTGSYTLGWDGGGYSWRWAQASDGVVTVQCATVYPGLYTPPTLQACSMDTFGSAARPTCLPRFVITQTGTHSYSCASFCDDGFQMYPPGVSPPPGASGPPTSAKAYPNPMKGSGQITFASLPAGGTARVYDFSGRQIASFPVDGSGNGTWSGNDATGRAVGTGVYLILVNYGGATAKLKVAIER